MFCTSCGNQLNEGQKFCPKCGTPSKGATVQTNAARPSADAQELATKKAEDEQQRLADAQRLKEKNEAAAQAAAEQAQKEAQEKRQREEAEQKLALAKAEEGKKKIEAEQKAREEAEKAAQERIREEERKGMEEMRKPLPDSILLHVRTVLLENGSFNQARVDDIYRKTRAAGIADERTKLQLEAELERFEKRAIPPSAEVPKKEQPKKKRKWRGLFWTIGILLFLGLLVGCGYVFRAEVLNTLDNWGLQTTTLRSKLGVVPSVPAGAETLLEEPSAGQRNMEETRPADLWRNEESGSDPIEEEAITEPGPEQRQEGQQKTSAIKPQSLPVSQTQIKPIPKPTVYTVVDQSPQYPGGNNAVQDYIDQNVFYPSQARRQDLTGTVYLKYVVKADGSIGEVEVTRGVATSLDEEAVRVIKSISGFSPGYKNGKAVNVYQSAKVRFML